MNKGNSINRVHGGWWFSGGEMREGVEAETPLCGKPADKKCKYSPTQHEEDRKTLFFGNVSFHYEAT
jgi:hypothetical protein